jgi:hypothetical protein
MLLGRPKVTKPLFKYIHDMKRFEKLTEGCPYLREWRTEKDSNEEGTSDAPGAMITTSLIQAQTSPGPHTRSSSRDLGMYCIFGTTDETSTLYISILHRAQLQKMLKLD